MATQQETKRKEKEKIHACSPGKKKRSRRFHKSTQGKRGENKQTHLVKNEEAASKVASLPCPVVLESADRSRHGVSLKTDLLQRERVGEVPFVLSQKRTGATREEHKEHVYTPQRGRAKGRESRKDRRKSCIQLS